MLEELLWPWVQWKFRELRLPFGHSSGHWQIWAVDTGRALPTPTPGQPQLSSAPRTDDKDLAESLCAEGAVAHTWWQDGCPSDQSWREIFAVLSVLLTQCLMKSLNTLSRAALAAG